MASADEERAGILLLLSSSRDGDASKAFQEASFRLSLMPKSWSRLAMCDTTSPTLIEAFPEIAVIEADKSLQGRLYKLISSKSSPTFDRLPRKIVLVVGMEPMGDLTEKEFHAWYEEEHTPLFSKIPGWRRTRRAELVDGDLGTPKFLAIHEWASEDSFKMEEYKYATSTTWRNHVVERVDQSKRERFIFEVGDSVK